jgi:septation ring formation regulator EzrA
MGESQSRYSIVERLTKTKLDIMTAKSELKEGIKHKEQKIEEIRKDLENWNKDIEEDIKRERREKERKIEKARQDYQNTKERLEEKERVYDEKLSAIDKALNSIEEISKTSPTVQS